MKRLDRLDSLRVVAPCPVPWSSMTGTAQVRFCDKCGKNVYNVSAMERAEALEAIDRAEGGACVRVTRRSDGTIVAGGCRARLRVARRRGLLFFLAVLPFYLALQLWTEVLGLRALVRLLPQEAPPPPATAPSPSPKAPALRLFREESTAGLGLFREPPPDPDRPRREHRKWRG